MLSFLHFQRLQACTSHLDSFVVFTVFTHLAEDRHTFFTFMVWYHMCSASLRLTLIHDIRHWYIYYISFSLLRILAEWCIIVKIRSWPGEKFVEKSWEAWRGAIMTEWGRNANQPAMRWVWAGREAHAYHAGPWKTTPPVSACVSCVLRSRHSLLLYEQL